MPFKDPERRRTFHREYKRRRRAELRASTPSQPLTRAYICFRYRDLRFPGGVEFREALVFVTDNPQEQALIEGSPDFRHNIHKKVELFCDHQGLAALR